MNEHYACTHCDWLGTLDEAADDCSVGPAATLCPDCFSHIEPNGESILKPEGQGGQGVGDAVELQVNAGREAPRFTSDVINQAIGSKDLADAIDEAEFGFYLVYKPERLQRLTKAHREENFPGLVADGDMRLSPAPLIEGVLFRDGKYFLVEGGRLHPLDSFGVHGPSPVEYIAKYLLSPLRQVAAVSEGTASAQLINKTIPLKACALSGCNYPEGGCNGECLPGGVRP